MVEDIRGVPPFLKRELRGNEPPWCVDGRPDYENVKGAQMLGASLHPVILSVIWSQSKLDEENLEKRLSQLKSSGFPVAVHWGSHRNPPKGKSDCGAADNLPAIIETSVNKRDEISRRLHEVYEANKKSINKLLDKPFTDIVNEAFLQLAKYHPENIELLGERLINHAVEWGAHVINLKGDHAEEAAFVNLEENVTFDTNKSNRRGRQFFNLDLLLAIEQAQALGVDRNFAIACSLILYQATEMVLVEGRGGAALETLIHIHPLPDFKS